MPLNSQQRFTALQSGEVDVLTRNTTVTQQRDTALGIIHAGINFYDGQGFMVPVAGRQEREGAQRRHHLLQTGTSNENTAGRLGARQPGQLQAGGDRNLQRSGQCCLPRGAATCSARMRLALDPHFAAREPG